MQKPILTIGIPEYADVNSLSDMVKAIKDYHVFLWIGQDLTKPDFQVIYEKDFNEMEYNEVVEMINKLSVK